MKMKKSLLALCLSTTLFAALPAATFAADVNIIPQDVSAAPAIPAAELQKLAWQPVTPPDTQTRVMDNTGVKLNVGDITGPIAAYSVPANIGELEISLTSEVNKDNVYAPNVLVLDGNMQPAAFFPSAYFAYAEPGSFTRDRLEGTFKLTPALGQQKLYLLIYTTQKDLQTTTQMADPAKVFARGTGNAVPDIPDPIAKHVTDGKLKLKVKSASSGSILVGPLFGSSDTKSVVVGNTAAPAPAAAPVAATSAPVATPAPAAKSEPVLNDTESYFNNAIKQAVKAGDVDKALKLLNEAERLGSTSARQTFISSVKGKG